MNIDDDRSQVSCRVEMEDAIDNYCRTTFSTCGTARKTARLMGFGAAAASGLLACNQVEADIQYSGQLNTTVSPGIPAAIDIDGSGDLEVGLFNTGSVSQTTRGFAIRRESADFRFIGIGSSMLYRGATSVGDASSGANFSAASYGWMGLAAGEATSTDPWGVFANEGSDQNGIFGFRFNGVTAGGGNGQMFGWMRLTLRYDDTSGSGTPGAGDTLSMTLVDYAYEDMGNAIHFGDTAVPEPGTTGAIALLALGAAGIRRRRKDQQRSS